MFAHDCGYYEIPRKTTVAKIFAKHYFGDERRHIQEFNASDERGIDVVREKIKIYTQ